MLVQLWWVFAALVAGVIVGDVASTWFHLRQYRRLEAEVDSLEERYKAFVRDKESLAAQVGDALAQLRDTLATKEET